jgi:iron complex outermembrane recepter protein
MMVKWSWAVAAVVLAAVSAAPAAATEPAGRAEVGGAADSAAVEGIVVDDATGRPLPGTVVRILGLGRQDMTHEGGEFHLLNLPAGRHTVLFERLGYRREVRTVDLAPRQHVELRIEMRASAIELPGIVVTGAPRAGLGDQAVRPATVVAGHDLLRGMDATLAGTLEGQPGMAVSSIGPATARPVIRGLGGDRVLVLEDGARTGDLSAASADHAVSVDPLNVERIEVVRGPTALLYGSNAIGGVINVIRDQVPTSLPDRLTGTLSLQGQSVNEGLGAGATVRSAVGSVALRGEGSARTAGDLRTPAGTQENTGLRTLTLGGGLAHVAGTGHVGAAYRYYENAYGIPGGFVGAHPFGVDVEMRRHSVQGEAALRRALGPFSSMALHGSYSNYYHRELEAEDIVGTEFGLLTASAELIGRHDARGPFSSGAAGARVFWQDYQAAGMETPPSRELNAALFLLEEVELGRLRLQGGARLDWHEVTPRAAPGLPLRDTDRGRRFTSLSASLGGLYGLTPGVSVGASLARAYRTPDAGELFSRGPHLAAYSFEVGNPELDAEVGMGLDAFVRVTGDRLAGEVAVFRNTVDHYIYYRDTNVLEPETQLPIYQATGADAVLEGFEVSGSAELVRRLVVNGVASYVRGTRTTTDTPLPMMPPLQGQLTARYDRTGYFAGLTWRAARAQQRVATDEFETPTPGFSTFGAEAGLRWVGFGRVQALTLRLENIGDELVHDHLSRVRDRETGRRSPGPGRSASLMYRMIF